jgi:putative DNA primase/helicase
MTAPLRKKERELCAAAKAERLTIESKRATDEARVKSLRASLANSEDFEHSEQAKQDIINLETKLPALPTIPSLWAQDVTPEKLGMLMAESGERLAVLSDEGGFFDIIAGRYSSGIPNLDICLQGHSCSPVKVNRGSRDELHLQRPTLTIGLSPQPSVLRDLTNKSILRDRGFLARALFALPTSRLGFRTLAGKPVPSMVETAYHRMIEALLAFCPPATNEDGQLAAYHLRPSLEAHREWKEFALTVERDMRPGARYEHMTDWAGKLPGAAVRVAGLFHCVQHAHGRPHEIPIHVTTMQQALTLLAILSAHALAVFDLMGADPALDGARRVWRWIDQGRRSMFTARECFQDLRGTFHRMANLDQAFAVLCERGYLMQGDLLRNGPGRPSRPYTVHPTLTKGWV